MNILMRNGRKVNISIRENSAVRRMEFTTNNLSYNCDRDEINKKIDGIHEQIEKNDATLATILKEFPTVDEVSEEDGKYALKTEISLVVQSDKAHCDTTAVIPSLAYFVNAQTNVDYVVELQNKIATFESRLAALEQNGNQGSSTGDLSSYAAKAEI